MYADDSALVSSHESILVLSTFLSEQLSICQKWLIDNKLSLHVGKTESMVFTTKRKRNRTGEFRVKCGESFINRVHSVKYLGVMLDDCLSGEEHVTMTISKISSRISFLYRNAHLLSQRCRQTFCSALIQPYFDYCCSSWYSGINAKYKARLDALQRRMVRFIFKMEPRDHVGREQLLRLKWFSVPNRVRYFKLIHVFKVCSNRAPRYIAEGFTRVSEIHNHSTRQSKFDFHLKKSDSLGQMSKSFISSAIKEWNLLPNNLKSIQKESSFKFALKTHLLDH